MFGFCDDFSLRGFAYERRRNRIMYDINYHVFTGVAASLWLELVFHKYTDCY